jgi:hypothetical protein
MTLELQGRIIGDLAAERLAGPATSWRVAFVGSRAVLLRDANERFLALIPAGAPLAPQAVALADWQRLAGRVFCGEEWRSESGGLRSERFTLSAAGLGRWDSHPPSVVPAAGAAELLAAVVAALEKAAPGGAAGAAAEQLGVPSRSGGGGEPFAGLVAELARLDPAPFRAHERIPRGLFGLGRGLTPEGDDLVAGWLAARHVCAACWGLDPELLAASTRGWLVREVRPLTTAFSAELLGLAAEGRLPAPGRRLLSSLEGTCLARARACMVQDLAAWGASTGWSLLAGIGLLVRWVIPAVQGAEVGRCGRETTRESSCAAARGSSERGE